MQRFKSLLRGLRRRLLIARSRWAGRAVRALTRVPQPSFFWNLAFRLTLAVYGTKRLLQDVVTGRAAQLAGNLRFRWREIETNFLIKLIVWRDWPIDRVFSLYDVYAENNVLSESEAGRMRELAADFSYRPFISILVPVFNAREEWIERLVDSILSQTYDRWELILVDDGSPDEATSRAIERQASRDDRISTYRWRENQGVVAATNFASEQAHGEWLAFVDHDDELFPDALWWLARHLQTDPAADVLYCDEEIHVDELDHAHGQFKPGYSPELLTAFNYMCHLLLVRRSMFESVGRLSEGTEGAQDFDLILRLSERTDRFAHIPRVLYRWHAVPQSLSRRVDDATGRLLPHESIDDVTRVVVQRHFDRLGVAARAVVQDHWVKARYAPVDRGRVTIIICSKDQPRRLARCIESIERHTRYPNVEILIVDNASREKETMELLDRLRGRHRVERMENGPDGFSFSRLNNLAAPSATGEYLLFLNDDTYVLPHDVRWPSERAHGTGAAAPIEHDWLSAMVGMLNHPGVGVVGAHLLYPSGLNQHAGLVMGALGWGPWHALAAVPPDHKAFLGYIGYPHNACAVTGACLLTHRRLFQELGGFDEAELAVSFNDVDYCLRARAAGHRIAYAPQARLVHEEGASRGRRAKPEEAAAMKRRGRGYIDPYWNPAFSRRSPHFALETRRRSRGLEIVPTPRVLRVSDVASSRKSLVHEALAELVGRRACTVDHRGMTLEPRENTAELRELLEGDTCDVLVLDGPGVSWAAGEAERARVTSIWALDDRILLPNSRHAADRSEFLKMIEALSLPYQVVFADPYSIGWAAAGLPRGNFGLEARIPMSFQRQGEEERRLRRREARESFSLDESQIVLLAVVGMDEWTTIQFLFDVVDGLGAAYAKRAFLIIGVEGSASAEFRRKLRDRIRHRPNVAAASVNESLYFAADIFLSHACIQPRPMATMEALLHRLPLIATPFVEQGDLMHSGASGLSARAFRRRDWRDAIQRLMDDAPFREELGRQGFFWLESRQSWEEIVDDWRLMLVEAAELTLHRRSQRQTAPRRAPRPVIARTTSPSSRESLNS